MENAATFTARDINNHSIYESFRKDMSAGHIMTIEERYSNGIEDVKHDSSEVDQINIQKLNF